MKSDSLFSIGSDYWAEKSWWCQPWTILLSGFIFILVSWNLFHLFFLTGFLAFLIFLWWLLFLLIAPSLYERQISPSDKQTENIKS